MAESRRGRLERLEDEHLAPHALRSSATTRRHPLEDEGRAFDYRTQFQRDRDRIVYSRAFRRLRQKAQAGILPDYEDHRRNRLTHTLEVTQIARTIARALRLNEDATEAIALAHDLGQPPFGPAGERALDDLMSGRRDGRGGPGLGDQGGFDHSWQSLRVVDQLEKRYGHPGLNLTDQVREGILKSGGPGRPPEPIEGVRPDEPPVPEAQVVRLADRLGSAVHDLDDALAAGSVDLARVERLRAVAELRRKLGERYPGRAGRFVRANAIHRGLTHLLVTGSILTSEKNLDARTRGGPRDRTPPALTGREVDLSPAGRRLLEELEAFLEAGIRRGQEADRVEARARNVVLGLVAAYHADPTLLEDHVLLRYREVSGRPYLRDVPRSRVADEVDRHWRDDPRFLRALVDHVSSMTDAFALVEYHRLHESGAVPIPSAEQLRRERR
jgi:dGTPase